MRNSGKRKSEKRNVAFCGMKDINLTKEIIKILGVLISYSKKVQDELY